MLFGFDPVAFRLTNATLTPQKAAACGLSHEAQLSSHHHALAPLKDRPSRNTMARAEALRRVPPRY